MVGWCVFIIIVKLLYCVYEREREREERESRGTRQPAEYAMPRPQTPECRERHNRDTHAQTGDTD